MNNNIYILFFIYVGQSTYVYVRTCTVAIKATDAAAHAAAADFAAAWSVEARRSLLWFLSSTGASLKPQNLSSAPKISNNWDVSLETKLVSRLTSQLFVYCDNSRLPYFMFVYFFTKSKMAFGVATLFGVTIILSSGILGVITDDAFNEELYIKSLPNGQLYGHFQFTTTWNVSLGAADGSCKGIFGSIYTKTKYLPGYLPGVLHPTR